MAGVEHRSGMRPDVIDRTTVHPVGSWSPGLTAAIKLRDYADSRPPVDSDRPRASVFPMTPAAREAKRLHKESKRR
jgi:hypothetical protein